MKSGGKHRFGASHRSSLQLPGDRPADRRLPVSGNSVLVILLQPPHQRFTPRQLAIHLSVDTHLCIGVNRGPWADEHRAPYALNRDVSSHWPRLLDAGKDGIALPLDWQASLGPGDRTAFEVIDVLQANRRRHLTGNGAPLAQSAHKQNVVACDEIARPGKKRIQRGKLDARNVPLGVLVRLAYVDDFDVALRDHL